ncbi:MAG: ATP-dependent sacrificial sulfur transferase LarE [Acetatifactor sp.]|nr:ATP-dependent sacrificial sulfur transferase LarE [Acetatifactor sp.]
MNTLQEKEQKLCDFLAEKENIAIAFSGGVDSAYLLYAAKKSGVRVKAYYVKAAFQPRFELEDAKRLAKELDVEMQILPVDVLSAKIITDNPANRCYYCKQKIFGTILEQTAADGFVYLADGTNASDQVSDRPGMKALQELSVLSPLRICDLSKQEVRDLSRAAGLFTWDKPSYACLATRIPTGVEITAEKLERTEKAEDYLMQLGFTDFRVRQLGNAAKLQIRAEQFPLLTEKRETIVSTLKEWYSDVLVDLEVR